MTVQDRFGDDATLESPYGFFDQIRAEAPVFFSPTLNMYVISRYADTQAILSNPQLFSSESLIDGDQISNYNLLERYQPLYEEAGVPIQQATLVITDGAEHRRYRSAVDRSFTISVVKRMEDQIAGVVHALIDRFISGSEADIYREFCLDLPLIIMCKLLGLPLDEQSIDILRRSAAAIVRLQGGAIETEEDRIALHQDHIAFHRLVLNHLERTRARPDGTLISQLISVVPEDGVPLNDSELLSIISSLNIGGNETTTNGLGNMFWACFREPGRQEELRADRDLIPKFVEETLRLESPVAGMPRWVKQDTEVSGVHIPKDSVIFLSFLAANRDPAHYGCPAQIDLDRKGIRNHVAFGGGPHFCLGAHLARSELKIAMNCVLDRMMDIRILDADRPLQHERKYIGRALKSLPIAFRATVQGFVPAVAPET